MNSSVQTQFLQDTMGSYPERMEIIRALEGFGLPDSWVAAGFVRNAVWDHLHGYRMLTPLNDIDVCYFDPADTSSDTELETAHQLSRLFPGERFSIKNQARMHIRNKHDPYTSTADAVSRWTETCTSVGVAWDENLQILAPHGLTDLLQLVVRPTSPDFHTRTLVAKRIADKGWLHRWPKLRILRADESLDSEQPRVSEAGDR
jgi:hypothetical protein